MNFQGGGYLSLILRDAKASFLYRSRLRRLLGMGEIGTVRFRSVPSLPSFTDAMRQGHSYHPADAGRESYAEDPELLLRSYEREKDPLDSFARNPPSAGFDSGREREFEIEPPVHISGNSASERPEPGNESVARTGKERISEKKRDRSFSSGPRSSLGKSETESQSKGRVPEGAPPSTDSRSEEVESRIAFVVPGQTREPRHFPILSDGSREEDGEESPEGFAEAAGTHGLRRGSPEKGPPATNSGPAVSEGSRGQKRDKGGKEPIATSPSPLRARHPADEEPEVRALRDGGSLLQNLPETAKELRNRTDGGLRAREGEIGHSSGGERDEQRRGEANRNYMNSGGPDGHTGSSPTEDRPEAPQGRASFVEESYGGRDRRFPQILQGGESEKGRALASMAGGWEDAKQLQEPGSGSAASGFGAAVSRSMMGTLHSERETLEKPIFGEYDFRSNTGAGKGDVAHERIFHRQTLYREGEEGRESGSARRKKTEGAEGRERTTKWRLRERTLKGDRSEWAGSSILFEDSGGGFSPEFGIRDAEFPFSGEGGEGLPLELFYF